MLKNPMAWPAQLRQKPPRPSQPLIRSSGRSFPSTLLCWGWPGAEWATKTFVGWNSAEFLLHFFLPAELDNPLSQCLVACSFMCCFEVSSCFPDGTKFLWKVGRSGSLFSPRRQRGIWLGEVHTSKELRSYICNNPKSLPTSPKHLLCIFNRIFFDTIWLKKKKI